MAAIETAKAEMEKVVWSGRIVAVQPRIRLIRSFDQRHHSYQGYVLRIDGICGAERGEFLIAVGKGAHGRHRFCAGMELSGVSVRVSDPRLDTATFYKTSGLKVLVRPEAGPSPMPPFQGVPPDLETYCGRGHRRLDVRSQCEKSRVGGGAFVLYLWPGADL